MSWFRRKKSFEVTAVPHFEEDYKLKTHSASEENMCFGAIQDIWSWANRESIRNAFNRSEPAIRGFISARLPAADAPLSTDERSLLVSFVLIQSLAYSYYLVMDLKSSIPSSININEVTNTMVEVFADCKFIGGERVPDNNTINIMVEQKDLIVVKTLGRLLANS